MPEITEVESLRRLAVRRLQGKSIVSVDARDGQRVLGRLSAQALARAIAGRTVRGIRRKGKYLWWELGGNRSLLLHLGMSGWIHFLRAGEPRPPYARVVFQIARGGEVAFCDPRRFGRIALIEGDPLQHPSLRRLGHDVLSLPAVTALQPHFRRRGPIKGLLLDQKVFAGVGNWIADEVLFQAGIAPQRPCASLSGREIARLHSSLRTVLRIALASGADSEKFPRSWLFHVRWGKRAGAVTSRGETVRYETVAGRTSAWVPVRQR
jgi:formamidopyrimidine-DNA glycosylase